MKKLVFLVAFIASFSLQYFLSIAVEKEFIANLLTIFAIFFGFYTTSFAVFATSKYMSRLYQIENTHDNRKTLLDDLLDEFSFATYFLLTSIVFFLVLYILVENKILLEGLYLLWGVIILNIFYAYRTISTFIKVTRQSAKNP